MPSRSWSLPMDAEAAALMLIYGEADGDTAECLVKIDPNGTPTVDSSGFSSGAGPNQPGPLEIFASSGGSASGVDSSSYLHGSRRIRDRRRGDQPGRRDEHHRLGGRRPVRGMVARRSPAQRASSASTAAGRQVADQPY